MNIRTGMSEDEKRLALESLSCCSSTYSALVQGEEDPVERGYLNDKVIAAGRVYDKVSAVVGAGELTAGELSTLDRALRMRAAEKQRLIKPGRENRDANAALRKEIDSIGALTVKLRQLRGLPW